MTDLRDQLQTTLGSAYVLEQELGGGGMSRVFTATETALGRQVVIKVLSPELAEGVSVERFKREIMLAAQLQHPHIVPVHAAGETNGLPFYTMPLVDGHSLRERLATGEPVPIADVISVLRDVAKALAYAHEHGVVHRDIKPGNVLLTRGSALVTDFGVAKALSVAKGAAADGATARSITQTGSSLGTPAYMAPEQAAADPDVNQRADIYAFGAVAYEMLAGHPPFHGRTPQQLLAAQMAERPEPIGAVRSDTPPLLAELVMKCLEKDPDARPQSSDALVQVLERVSGADAVTTGARSNRGPGLGRALALWTVAFVATAILARAAIIAIGLPDWVFPGALLVAGLGLPAILFTAFVQRGAQRAITPSRTPAGTPAEHSTLTRLAAKASPWVSWRSTTAGGAVTMAAFALLVVGFMVLRALGIGPAGSLLAAGRVTDRERLLITAFRAPGADSTLGNIVSEAVRTDLGQSSVVSVMPPNEVASALARMQRPETTHVSLALARDIAAREGLKGIVDGDVVPLGGGYVMTLRLVDAQRGDELASYHATVDGPKEMIPTIDRLTRQLRGKIGESLRTVHASPPLDQVTTASLEALRKYAQAARAADFEGDFPKALSLLQEAVALDTGFAMAWRKMGVVLSNTERPRSQVDAALEKAYRLRDRLPERERLMATASYFDLGPGRDRQQAANAYNALLALDSTDQVALIDLAQILRSRRDYASAELLYRRAMREQPSVLVSEGLVQALVDGERLAAAESALIAGHAAFPDQVWYTGIGAALVSYARGHVDSAEAALVRESAAPDAFSRAIATHALADDAMLRGRLAESARRKADAWGRDSALGSPDGPVDVAVWMARYDIWFRGQSARGVQRLDDVLARSQAMSLVGQEVPYLEAAELYAIAGRVDRARAILAQYAAVVVDTATLLRFQPQLHRARGELALAEHRPLDALTEFRRSDQRPDGPANACAPCVEAWLGRAFDAADMPDSTIGAYEHYLATPNVLKLENSLDPWFVAGMHKRLGELYEAEGDRARAVSHYLQFVALWKHADPDLQPKVAEVRRRLARLGDVERP